ncbi:PIG-L family deacetylase [Herbiconiux liangxiaofengii]|uniref:PIG-L family deacetylase n=1 Tax=Herbiconiux liangxiaofengii TaxID=3342795 RepID=UPI0035B86413
MSVFTHRDDSTAEQRWTAAFVQRSTAGELGEIGPSALAELGHLVVVAAHPDDETLGAAGLLARAYAAGVRTTVIVATSGEASHPESTTHTPGRLAELREGEAEAAVASVDPGATVSFLRVPDGGLAEPVNRSRLEQALLAAVRGDSGAAGSAGAGPGAGSAGAGTAEPVAETWIVSPWSGDRHPDHAAASEVVGAVVGSLRAEGAGTRVRRLEYPVWLWHWGDPDGGDVPWDALVTLALDEEAVRAKRRAMALHATQVQALGDAPGDSVLLAPGMLAHFERAFEAFVEVVSGDVTPGVAPAAAPAEATATGEEPTVGTAARYFDALHTGADDPWGFETRWYEERKRGILLATLPDRGYRAVLEVGTSTGVLSRELAARASVRFVGVDVSPVAVARAAERNHGLPHASFERRDVPDEWPEGRFDLVVVSEVGYYLAPGALDRLIDRAVEALDEHGALVFCHWRHPIDGIERVGDDVHAVLAARPELIRLAHHLEEDFVLDVVVRPPAVSVAAKEGIV